jgi:hypothetical protein
MIGMPRAIVIVTIVIRTETEIETTEIETTVIGTATTAIEIAAGETEMVIPTTGALSSCAKRL